MIFLNDNISGSGGQLPLDNKERKPWVCENSFNRFVIQRRGQSRNSDLNGINGGSSCHPLLPPNHLKLLPRNKEDPESHCQGIQGPVQEPFRWGQNRGGREDCQSNRECDHQERTLSRRPLARQRSHPNEMIRWMLKKDITQMTSHLVVTATPTANPKDPAATSSSTKPKPGMISSS